MTSHSEDDVTHPLLHRPLADEPKTDDPRYPEFIRDEELKKHKVAAAPLIVRSFSGDDLKERKRDGTPPEPLTVQLDYFSEPKDEVETAPPEETITWPEPAFDDVMIDIETMSLHPHKALVLSIGMIEFDPTDIKGLRIGKRELIVLDLAPQLLSRRRVDEGTQQFWHTQPAEASRHWTAPTTKRVHPQWAMCQVKEVCFGRRRIWANGTQFDLSNLVGLGEEYGVQDLWHYQAPRDMRTFVKQTPQTRIVPIGDALDIPGVPHDPIYDCISQAWQVWAHWQ